MSFRERQRNQMVYYHNSITEQDLILSIDNIVLDVSITRPDRIDLLYQMLTLMSSNGNVTVQTWQGSGAGAFRNQTLVKLDAERSFWVGQGLIGNGTLLDRVRLDFNPNKIGDDSNLNIIREFLVRNSRECLCRIPRFDLAIDIPVAREKCFLVKDRRLYIERRHGVEFTQYLGARSSRVGRVKLYNKTAEAGLDYPLTRLELTLDPNKSYEELNFPEVYMMDDLTLTMADTRFTKTDQFIVNAVLHGCGKVTDLGRKTGEKIKRLLGEHLRKVEISADSYTQILNQIEKYRT